MPPSPRLERFSLDPNMPKIAARLLPVSSPRAPAACAPRRRNVAPCDARHRKAPRDRLRRSCSGASRARMASRAPARIARRSRGPTKPRWCEVEALARVNPLAAVARGRHDKESSFARARRLPSVVVVRCSTRSTCARSGTSRFSRRRAGALRARNPALARTRACTSRAPRHAPRGATRRASVAQAVLGAPACHL